MTDKHTGDGKTHIPDRSEKDHSILTNGGKLTKGTKEELSTSVSDFDRLSTKTKGGSEDSILANGLTDSLVAEKSDKLSKCSDKILAKPQTTTSVNHSILKSNKEVGAKTSDQQFDTTDSVKSIRKLKSDDEYNNLSSDVKSDDYKSRHEQGLRPDSHLKIREEKSLKARNEITEDSKDKTINSSNAKKNRILEKCEIFENTNKTIEIDKSDSSRGRISHILVSRADVEKSKQNRLVSVRRNRSLSEEPRKQFERERDRGLWDTRSSRRGSENTTGKPAERESRRDRKTDPDDKVVLEKTVDNTVNTAVDSSVDKKCETKPDTVKSIKFDDKSVICGEDRYRKHSLDVNKLPSNGLFNSDIEHDSKVNPSIAWLQEKRKSVPTPHDIEKLMSTMEIEAAFSEILDAVEKFPEEKSVVESVATVDGPIMEEGSDSSGMEEDLNKNKKSVPNNEITHKKVKEGQGDDSGVENGENDLENMDYNELNNKNSAIHQQSGNKPTGNT